MGGFMGIGGASRDADRSRQLDAMGNLDSVFNWALPSGQAQVAKGGGNLDQATGYWRDLLSGGRADTAMRAAPAINATYAQSDALRREAEARGTSRTGGDTAFRAESGARASSSIDDIINAALTGGRETGAKGLASAGEFQTSSGLNLSGLGVGADRALMENATKSRVISNSINQGEWGKYMDMINFLSPWLMKIPGLGGGKSAGGNPIPGGT